MRFKHRILSPPKARRRRGDGLRLTIAIGGVIASLGTVYFTAGYVKHSLATSAANKAALAIEMEKKVIARANRERQKHRTGSIVTAYPGDACTELRFDNLTGAFVSLENVDCEKRLEPPTLTVGQGAPSDLSSMRDVLASFRK
jgi:hypothetical protein